MLVLTVKDQHRIAVWYQADDAQELLGWLQFHAPKAEGRDPGWTFLHASDGMYSVYPSEFITKLECPNGALNRIECLVSKHSRTQWQAKFAAPYCIRLIREKAVLKHGATPQNPKGGNTDACNA